MVPLGRGNFDASMYQPYAVVALMVPDPITAYPMTHGQPATIIVRDRSSDNLNAASTHLQLRKEIIGCMEDYHSSGLAHAYGIVSVVTVAAIWVPIRTQTSRGRGHDHGATRKTDEIRAANRDKTMKGARNVITHGSVIHFLFNPRR